LLAVIFSVLILQETMQVIQIIGSGLIIGGAVFGECAEEKLCRKFTRNPINDWREHH
jgi:hypothetical protein